MNCVICGKKPGEIEEYVWFAQNYHGKGVSISPQEYVRLEEGTFNPQNGLFCCTSCYIDIDQPVGLAVPEWRNLPRVDIGTAFVQIQSKGLVV